MVQRLGLPTRRGIVTCAVAIGIALSAGGCSVIEKAQSVAVVNGQQITVSDVASTVTQYNEFVAGKAGQSQAVTTSSVTSGLILASFVVPYAESKGLWKPDTTFNDLISTIPGARADTIQLLRLYAILNPDSSKLTAPDVASITASMKQAKIEVDPRYGSFDPTTGQLATGVRNWIKPQPQPNAPDPATGQ